MTFIIEIYLWEFYFTHENTKYTKLYSCLLACFVGNMLLLKAA